MRTPPAASIDCVAGAAWRGVQAALHASAAVALLAWGGEHLGWGGGSWVAALLGGAIAAKLGWALSAASAARLRWTGSQWLLRLQGAEEVAVEAPAVMFDLGGWLLLRVQAAGMRARWLTASRQAAVADWSPFRVAVYSAASDSSPRSPSERRPF